MHNHNSIFHVLPQYRIAPYFIGILLAIFIIKLKNKKISDFHLNLGWLISLTSLILTTIISIECLKNSKLALSLFASICTINLCFFIGWIIFTSEMGYKNFLTTIIEWKFWRIFGNLSFTIYLVQFAVFHHNIGKVRSAGHFSLFGTFVSCF